MSLRVLLAPALALILSGPACADEVVVFAAASLKTALDQVAEDFETASGHQVRISYGGSNTLAKQIIQGAPADIFISAAVNWMDEVEASGLLAAGSRRDLLGNRLVLIAHDTASAQVIIDSSLDLPGLLQGGRLSMATVTAVPAGQYGKAALESLGLWASAEPLVVQTDSVRAALNLVSAGEAPLGIVYATDAAADDAVTVIGSFPAESHPPIVYPAAKLASAQGTAVQGFFEALTGATATAIFQAQGFTIRD